MEFRTRAIHVGNERCRQTGAVVPPLHFASTFRAGRSGEMGRVRLFPKRQSHPQGIRDDARIAGRGMRSTGVCLRHGRHARRYRLAQQRETASSPAATSTAGPIAYCTRSPVTLRNSRDAGRYHGSRQSKSRAMGDDVGLVWAGESRQSVDDDHRHRRLCEYCPRGPVHELLSTTRSAARC